MAARKAPASKPAAKTTKPADDLPLEVPQFVPAARTPTGAVPIPPFDPSKALADPRREKFVLCLLTHHNKARALREAGYVNDGTGPTPYKLWNDSEVRARYKWLIEEKFRQLHMNADEILARCAAIARADIRHVIDENGAIANMHELDLEEAAGVASLEINEIRDEKGNAIGEAKKVRLRDPMPALRLLAEHARIIKTPDEGLNNLASAIADRLKAARERRKIPAATSPTKESPK